MTNIQFNKDGESAVIYMPFVPRIGERVDFLDLYICGEITDVKYVFDAGQLCEVYVRVE